MEAKTNGKTMKYLIPVGLGISFVLTFIKVVFHLIAWPGGAIYMLMGFLALPLLLVGLMAYQTIWPSDPDTTREQNLKPKQQGYGEIKLVLREDDDLPG